MMHPLCTQCTRVTNVGLDIYTDTSWYKETHRLRWVSCYPCKHRAKCTRFQSGFAGVHDPAHMGYFAREIPCTESRNDAHPLRRAAFLLPLLRKECAYHYTVIRKEILERGTAHGYRTGQEARTQGHRQDGRGVPGGCGQVSENSKNPATAPDFSSL